MNNSDMDYEIAQIYQEDVQRRPARKTNTRAGSHDCRCIPSWKEAQWQNWEYESEFSYLGDYLDYLEPHSMSEDSEIEDE